MVSDVRFGAITADVCRILCVCVQIHLEKSWPPVLWSSQTAMQKVTKENIQKRQLFCFRFVIQLFHPNIVKTAFIYLGLQILG